MILEFGVIVNVNKETYFRNHKILFDSIYRYVDIDDDPRLITRFPHANTVDETMYNILHWEARVIVENTVHMQDKKNIWFRNDWYRLQMLWSARVKLVSELQNEQNVSTFNVNS